MLLRITGFEILTDNYLKEKNDLKTCFLLRSSISLGKFQEAGTIRGHNHTRDSSSELVVQRGNRRAWQMLNKLSTLLLSLHFAVYPSLSFHSLFKHSLWPSSYLHPIFTLPLFLYFHNSPFIHFIACIYCP